MWASSTPNATSDGTRAGPFPTITQAIAAAQVLTAPKKCVRIFAGTYPEALLVAYGTLDMAGVDGRDNVIIGGNLGSALSVENATVAVSGLTLSHGAGTKVNYTDGTYNYVTYSGGGLYQLGGSVTLTDVALTNNSLPTFVAASSTVTGISSVGGGFYASGGTLVLDHVLISGNYAYFGGGFGESGTRMSGTHVTQTGDSASIGGAGEFQLGSLSLSNSIIANEGTDGFTLQGAEVDLVNDTLYNLPTAFTLDGSSGQLSALSIENSIISAGGGAVLQLGTGSSVVLKYSDVYVGGVPFSGIASPADGTDISGDPQFVGAGDYHLQPTSPCAHTGDPNVYNDDGRRSDMGRYGGPTGTEE